MYKTGQCIVIQIPNKFEAGNTSYFETAAMLNHPTPGVKSVRKLFSLKAFALKR